MSYAFWGRRRLRVRASSGAPDPVSGDCGHDGGGDARQRRSEPRAAPVWGKGMSRAAAGGPTESPDCALTAPPSPVLAVSGRSRTHVTNIAVVPARTGRVRKRGAAQRAGVSRTDTRTQRALLLLSDGLHEERTREKQIIREEAGLGAAAATSASRPRSLARASSRTVGSEPGEAALHLGEESETSSRREMPPREAWTGELFAI